MTRLFLRFFSGVLLILFVAWLIQAYVFRWATDPENIVVIENALSGGALSARDDLVDGRETFNETLAKVRSRFAYPIAVVTRGECSMPKEMELRINRGEAVLYYDFMIVAFPDSPLLLQLGPLPRFAVPRQRDVWLGLGSVFLLAAGAIAILMRPIAKQFRMLERTALAIASGNFSARIPEGNAGLPIVGAFNTMAAQVESLLRSQKELLQAVSHELRTPLARIKFAAELVRSADDDYERLRRIDSIDEATDRLDDLVGELLDYTRLEEATDVLAWESVSADKIVAESIAMYAPLHPQIAFVAEPTSPPAELTTYRAGLLRAVGNLVSNAGKYAATRVVVSVVQWPEATVFCVDDDGPGIAESDRKIVFEPFKRLSNQSQPGAGLGLALVRRICQRLQGEVSITTSPLGGARFEISLPTNSERIAPTTPPAASVISATQDY